MQIVASTAIRDRTPYIGRVRERSLLAEELEAGSALLTLTGPSGIGKTRLARQLLAEVAQCYSDEGGAWFCSLIACQSSADAEAVVARTLGVPQQEGEELARALANRGRMLLVLDNLDSVAAEVGPLLGSWLDRCPQLQLVTTSIVPIEVDGEVRIELGPLEASDAIALYLERAHRAWAGRSFPEAERSAVEELVGRLDRIPLAIELAAARIRVLPPRALLSRFGERFELLRSSSTKGRHGSLVEALTLTWELLPKREQAILARASVFEGGFTYDAATAILDEDAELAEMLDVLDGLRSKALLQFEETDPPRFSLFESVREFARRELAQSGLEAETVRRHAAYFVELGEKHARDFEGPKVLSAISWLKAERENLITAHLRNREANPSLSARAGIVLAPILSLEGHSPTELKLLEGTLRAARASKEPKLLTKALEYWSYAIVPHGRVDEALAAVDEGLALADRVGDREAEGHLLVCSASVRLRLGELDIVIEQLDRAIAISREEGLPYLEGAALMTRASATARFDQPLAEKFFTEALAILRHHEFLRQEAIALNWAAGTWTTQGRFREARRALHDALATFRRMGNRFLEAGALMSLGGVALAAGILDESEAHSLESLALQREIGNLRGEGLVCGNLGFVALERGDLALAERRLVDAVGILKETGDRHYHAAVLPFLAVLEARVGRSTEARQSLAEARAYFEGVGDRASVFVTELLEGSVELAEARSLPVTRLQEAEALVARARARLEEATPARLGTADCRFEAVRLLEQDLERWRAGSREIAVDVSNEGLKISAEAGWFETPDGRRVDMRRRVAIRRILAALAEQRLDAPGEGLTPFQLFEIGWPGEQLHPEGATRRVYLGIWTLRDLGLGEVLLNQTDGYLLDPNVPLHRPKD